MYIYTCTIIDITKYHKINNLIKYIVIKLFVNRKKGGGINEHPK